MFRRIGPGTKWADAVNMINNNYRTLVSYLNRSEATTTTNTANIATNTADIATLLSRVQAPVDWTAPTFTNSWVNYGSGYNDCAYMRDALGFVHLRGLVKNGTDGTSIFTLPVGFRPVGQELMSGSSVDLFGRIDINTAGNVIPSAATTAPGWVSLDGITFKAVQ